MHSEVVYNKYLNNVGTQIVELFCKKINNILSIFKFIFTSSTNV